MSSTTTVPDQSTTLISSDQPNEEVRKGKSSSSVSAPFSRGKPVRVSPWTTREDVSRRN